MAYDVYFQNNKVTAYTDEVSVDYNDLLNNWKVKIDGIQYDCYIKSMRYQDNGVGAEYNGFYYTLSVFNHNEVSFEVWTKENSITLKSYIFQVDLYESAEFEKIAFVEKSNYIDVISDCVSMSDILECISQKVKSQTQYYFDKYSGINVSFATVPYQNLFFKLNNALNTLDVYLHIEYYIANGGGKTEQIEKCCSFKIYQNEFFSDFFKGLIECRKDNQCNISVKNSTPSIAGGNNQYYSKSEIDIKLNELKSLIRAITTTPDAAGTSVTVTNNAILKMDDNQLKALAHLMLMR